MKPIKKVAVLGAGVMGHGIAAHLAGAGIPSLLLDIVPPQLGEDDAKAGFTPQDPRFRNKFALAGIEAVKKSKPSLIYSQRDLKLITPGNFEDDWDKLKECDWIVEVVVERLDIKQQVFSRVEQVMKDDTIITSNTSGLPLRAIAEGRSEKFRKNFLLTHFFNPVRYMKLVEIISSPDTDPQVVKNMANFLEDVLGKGVVYAKDTPNFIANRIGIFAFMASLRQVIEGNYTIEEADKILGPVLGKPKSALFRTADLVGIDTIAHVVKNTYDHCPQDEARSVFVMPEVVNKMIAQKWLGDKTKQGFYKKIKNAEGKKEILSLDLKTGEYRPKQSVKFESLAEVKDIENVGERIKTFLQLKDRATELAWKVTRDTLLYTAQRLPEIADDIVNIDNAMKWGFNWDMGPFEVLDAIGVKETIERIQKEGLPIPNLFKQVLEKGEGTFYKRKEGKRFYFDISSNHYKAVPQKETALSLRSLKEQNKVAQHNDAASLIDVGDGVLCLEFHSKMNAIDDGIIEMGLAGLELCKKDFKGMVITNEGQNFSVGANLMLLWLEAQQKSWDKIEAIVKAFQDFCMALKYSPKPVVAAPFGMTLGGGCEVVMGADSARAYAETYIGLVEVGVGLIPGGGGCKNMLLNAEASLRAKGQKVWASPGDGGPFPKVQKAFERIGFAKVATSAKEGIELDYLKPSDKITLNRERLLYDAKQDVLEMAKNYVQATPREDILVPGVGGKMAMVSGIRGFLAQGLITEYDAVIAEKLAHVLCAGNLPTQGLVSEQYLLDLEREVFLQLCGDERSQARMQNMLMTGKPLRN